MHDFDSLIIKQKDYLPVKAKKVIHLKVIWIEPPLNDNFHNNVEQAKYNKSLESIAMFHENTFALKLKKI